MPLAPEGVRHGAKVGRQTGDVKEVRIVLVLPCRQGLSGDGWAWMARPR